MKKIGWVIMAIVLLSIPTYAGAAPVLDETVGVLGSSWEIYSFVADQTSLYELTLTDFDSPVRFSYLGATITTSTKKLAEIEILSSSINDSKTTTFNAEPGTKYFASVLGITADTPGAGLFGIEITAVPVPPALLLLGSGLFALFALKKRN